MTISAAKCTKSIKSKNTCENGLVFCIFKYSVSIYYIWNVNTYWLIDNCMLCCHDRAHLKKWWIKVHQKPQLSSFSGKVYLNLSNLSEPFFHYCIPESWWSSVSVMCVCPFEESEPACILFSVFSTGGRGGTLTLLCQMVTGRFDHRVSHFNVFPLTFTPLLPPPPPKLNNSFKTPGWSDDRQWTT